MALVLADRVRETTTTAGTGTITLLGAVPSCQSFAAVGNGNTTYYTIVAYSGTEWEVGIGTYTASGTTLSRDTVLSSSNSGSLVNFSAGTKDVFVDYPAGRAVYEDAAGNVDGYPITGGTINNTTIGATTPSTGVFTTLTSNSTAQFGRSLTSYIQADGGTTPYVLAQGAANANVVFGSNGTGTIFFRTQGGGTTQAAVSHTASAVNYVQVTGAATGGIPAISAQGSDSTVALNLSAKGGTGIVFFTNSGANRGFRVTHAANSVNYLTAEGSATGQASRFYTTGTDSNIPIALQTTGTGAIDLAAGSSGVNISNGGTVTALTRTAAGSNYTSAPSIALSAPTTAGGVQATASATISVNIATPTITSGGTGYTAGDVLTFVGGTSTVACQLSVSAVSGGVITGVTVINGGIYTVAPSNPISVTGGTGAGATFTSVWGVTSTITITNAGSGYVEQPTVTFSGGGGGSGAAAYATVGSTPKIQTLASNLEFYSPSGRSFQIQNSPNVNPVNFIAVSPNSTGQPPYLSVNGTDTNIAFYLFSKGTSGVESWTNGGRQFLVSNTTSAVNYVQVTGAATGAGVNISSQGSDSGVNLFFTAKGAAGIRFYTNSGVEQFRINPTASAVNYVQVTGGIATAAPVLSAQGTDTNIDLTLTPKGTGLVRFGTYTAGAPTATGYISIKAADGTTYKVLVGT